MVRTMKGQTVPVFLGVVFWSLCAAAQGAPEEQGAAKGGKYTLEQYERGTMDPEIAAKLEQISQLRRQQIAKLEELLRNPYYENKAEVYFRLAEAYWEESLYQYLQARQKYEDAMAKYEAGLLTERPVEPVEDYSISLEYYRKVLREFPNYARIDEVIYYLGKGALKEGKTKRDRALRKEGEEYLKRLVQNYPNSKFIANAHLALGEYYFENNSLYFAKNHYEQIIKNYPRSPMYNYALYKLAWVYFNLREFDKAIETFHQVVEHVSKAKGKGVVEFREQALNDLVVTYAEVDNGWVLARDYFLKVLPEDQAYKKLRALADLYVAQDKDEEAIALFRHFIEREKVSENIPEYFGVIFGIYKKVNDVAALDRVVAEALEYFKPNGTWRTVMESRSPEAVREADGLCEEYLHWLANHYHQEAQRLNDDGLYRRAAEKYALYLERFPNAKRAYVVNFYYAEILYDRMRDFKAAAEQYKKVIERDTKGEYVEEAALGIIHCYEELMVQAGLQERAKGGRTIEVVKVDPKKASAPIPETDLHPLEHEYVAAADHYVSLMTDLIKDPEVRKKNPERGQKIPEIMFIAAQVYYRHGRFAEAVKRLKILFEYDPSSKFAAYAVFTLLDAYQRLKQWPKVEEWARKLIAAKNFTVKSKAELEKIVAIAMTENARLLSSERRYSDAIKEAMRVYEEFRGDEKTASKALFNVAALYEGQKNIDMAVKTYMRVVKEFPRSEVAPEALFTVALIYESQTQFEKAAETFEKLEAYKDYQAAPDALQNAGLIREALGEYEDAIEAYRKFIKLFPTHKDAPRVDLRIGIVMESGDNPRSYQRAYEHYTAWLKKYKGVSGLHVEASTRAGVALKKVDKVKNRKSAEALLVDAIQMFGKLTDPDEIKKSRKYAAQAAFELADYAFDDFAALRIPPTLDPRVLRKALQAKAEAQQKAEKMFEGVLQYKSGGWSAGALFKIGLLYYDFANELNSVPVPEGLDPDTIIEYQAVLDEIARPVWEKALKAFERALRLAHEEKVYNPFSKACGEYAVKVNPESFPVAGDELVHAEYTRDTVTATSFIRTLRRGEIEVKMVEEGGR